MLTLEQRIYIVRCYGLGHETSYMVLFSSIPWDMANTFEWLKKASLIKMTIYKLLAAKLTTLRKKFIRLFCIIRVLKQGFEHIFIKFKKKSKFK